MTRQGVLVVGEIADGKLTGTSREAVAVGLHLINDSGGLLTGLLIGTNLQEKAQELVQSGAQKVLTVENSELTIYQPDAYVQIVEKAIEQTGPKIVIMGQSDLGRDLAPKIAFRIGASLTMDAVGIAMSDGNLQVTKPVYGGNAQATYRSGAEVHVLTLRAKAFEAREFDSSLEGAVDPLEISIDDKAVKVRVREVKKEESTGVRLEDASVVVAGGRGLGGPEPFEQLEELAQVLGGAVGASRAVCDAGWLDHAYQVGLTGKTVTPDLYLAVAISGASQHMAGCSGSKVIIAINKDKDCNIFKESRYGVVGSWEEILPAFTEMVRELKGS